MGEKRSRRLLIIDGLTALFLLFLDQFTKYLAISRLKGSPSVGFRKCCFAAAV